MSRGLTTKTTAPPPKSANQWFAGVVAWATGDEEAAARAASRRVDLFDDLGIEDRLHALQRDGGGSDGEIACLQKAVACHESCLARERKCAKGTCRGMDENTKSWPWIVVNVLIVCLSVGQEVVLAIGGDFLDRSTDREYVLAICIASLIALDEVKLLVAFHVERGDAPPKKRGCCGRWKPMDADAKRGWMVRQRWTKRAFSLFALGIPFVQSAFVCIVAWQVDAFPWWIAITTVTVQLCVEICELVLTHCVDAQVRWEPPPRLQLCCHSCRAPSNITSSTRSPLLPTSQTNSQKKDIENEESVHKLIGDTVGAGSALGDSEETKAMSCAAGCLSMSFELHLVGSITLGFMLVLPEFLVAETFLNSFPFAIIIITAFSVYDLVFLMWHPRGLVIWFWRLWTCATKASLAVETKSETAKNLPCGVTTMVVLMTWSGTGILVVTLPLILALNFGLAIKVRLAAACRSRLSRPPLRPQATHSPAAARPPTRPYAVRPRWGSRRKPLADSRLRPRPRPRRRSRGHERRPPRDLHRPLLPQAVGRYALGVARHVRCDGRRRRPATPLARRDPLRLAHALALSLSHSVASCVEAGKCCGGGARGQSAAQCCSGATACARSNPKAKRAFFFIVPIALVSACILTMFGLLVWTMLDAAGYVILFTVTF